MMKYRKEKDSLGYVNVPAERYWGPQTQRSLQNFKIGGHQMPDEVIRAFAILKKAAALTNRDLGVLDADKARSRLVRAAAFFRIAKARITSSEIGRAHV